MGAITNKYKIIGYQISSRTSYLKIAALLLVIPKSSALKSYNLNKTRQIKALKIYNYKP